MDAYFKLLPAAVFTASPDDKQTIFDLLADRFAATYAVSRNCVLESLLEREALGSTGFGRGVAIPHARSDGIQRPAAVFLKLESAVEFAAADGLPVDLVFGLLSPRNAGASHLHALAAISRLVRDEAVHHALVEATDPATLYALLSSASDRDVA